MKSSMSDHCWVTDLQCDPQLVTVTQCTRFPSGAGSVNERLTMADPPYSTDRCHYHRLSLLICIDTVASISETRSRYLRETHGAGKGKRFWINHARFHETAH
ncbi:unnamed protein product [Mycena citricolor]|uniref:Uncharacterized protein n=1 Tax=Mycena citricolor TaxID=2018698 RepID=A0AAD2JTY9_9AGAR|nr:unnamed protein product [Mycena citricolor]